MVLETIETRAVLAWKMLNKLNKLNKLTPAMAAVRGFSLFKKIASWDSPIPSP